ncbi:MAG: serine/threonine-protein kinase, partial [Acidobacteriota bacterium]
MNSERLKLIEKTYHAALEIQSAKREIFLKNNCGADEDLRREVESLLLFENSSDDFLETPPESLAAEIFSEKNNHNDLIGRKIRHYKIQKLLGKGGMGEVYLAHDEKLHRNIALKILPKDFANDRERMSRFVQEARAASALNHANILTIYEIGEIEDVNFIAAEYIAGITLTDYLKQEHLNFKIILDIAIQIASALVAAHEAGVIHRDIKPDNVMIRKDGV